MVHRIYCQIINAVKSKKLKEPFFPRDIKKAIPKMNKKTSHTFPSKHKRNNTGNNSELFIRLKNGTYKLIRPFKYDLK